MLYLLGTDEAGYGPNLGPLVIAATLWQIDDAELGDVPDLYERFACGVVACDDDARLAIADSKQLYQAGGSLAALERGVLAALTSLERCPQRWQHIWDAVSPTHACDLPWHRAFDCDLPYAVAHDDLAGGANLLREAFAAGRARLVDIRATILHPADFNDRCDRLASKGAVLSAATLSLAKSLLAQCEDAPVQIVCDKHGGRNRYAGLVWQELAADDAGETLGFPIQTVCESRDASIYRWRRGDSPCEIRFVTRGERFLPAALASMTAKYLRELSMLAFNAFWAERVPNLRPTAGYPGDSHRFWSDIESLVRLARFEERALWREK
jgi:hypothetical protein